MNPQRPTGLRRDVVPPDPQGQRRDSSAVEDIWRRYGMHSGAATLTY